MWIPAPLWLVKILDSGRNDEIVWYGRIPTGERVVLTRSTVKHIQGDRSRNIKRVNISDCLENPSAIYRETRPAYARHTKLVVIQPRITPHGPKKAKSFIVHVKRCRKLLVFKVWYVSTALISPRLPPGSEQVWP